MEITSNVFQVGGDMFSTSQDAAVYLLKSKNEAALIDAGTGFATDKIFNNIISIIGNLEKIRYVFITHCHFDHTGGLAEIKPKLNARLVAHQLDSEYIEQADNDVTAASWYGSFIKPVSIDIKVSKKQQSFKVGGLDVDFYNTPGHSPGSSVLLVNSDNKKVLFGQDVHGPLNESLLSNRQDYMKSLEFLLTLEADILCEGHFGIYEGQENVQKFITSYL